MNRSEFEVRLNEVYSCDIKPLITDKNDRATLCFHCTKCGLQFFNKPGHMVGKEHQSHACGYPYGDRYGERLSKVSTVHKKRKTKGTLNVDQLNPMIWEDYTFQ